MKNINLRIMKTVKNRILFVLLLCLIQVFLSKLTIIACNNRLAEQIVSIENGKIKLGFDRDTGAFLVFRDLVNSQELLDRNIINGSLWEIDVFQSSGIETIDMTTPSEFHFSKPDPLTLVLTWDNFSGIENKDLQITAVITLNENKPLSYWKISLEGIEGMKVNRVVFPKITGLNDPGKGYLAVPVWMGQLMKDPVSHLLIIQDKERKYEWDYPGSFSMQCMALYDPEKCGFYASCNDSLAYRKNFSFSLDTSDNFVYQMINYPAFDSALNVYSTPYDAVIGSFKGDWITAAEQYREWGSKQRWCSESRFKNRLTPAWLEETALWVWNRGKSGNVLVPAADLKQRLELPVNVFWHWWHGCSYDDGFPDYFPPREGKKSFISALSSAQEKDIKAIVYMNQVLWGTSTESWKKENAAAYSAKDIDGKTISQVFNIFTGQPLAYMCMTTQFWKDKYSSLCDNAVNTYHTNGVYMDMACTSVMCYDTSHGHSLGGGNYWVKNFGKLTHQIRSKISQNDEPILAGEGGGEAWLPYLDAFLTLQVSRERYAGIYGWETREKQTSLGGWETIPFFQAVYHQYGITYGSYSSLIVPPYDELWPKEFAPKNQKQLLDEDFNKQFLMEQARSFVWGMQPTIANYQGFLASERKEEIDYLMNLAKVRYQGLKYLLYGEFLRSPDIEIPEEELMISKLSIYAGRKGESVTTFQKSFPLIYSGTWRSDDNQVGIALASISDNPFKVNFSFNSSDYDLSASGKIYIIDIEGRKLLTSYADGKIQVNFTLPPKGLCIVEITPNI